MSSPSVRALALLPALVCVGGLLGACTFTPPSAAPTPSPSVSPTGPIGGVQTDSTGRRHVGRVAVVPVRTEVTR